MSDPTNNANGIPDVNETPVARAAEPETPVTPAEQPEAKPEGSEAPADAPDEEHEEE